MNRRPICPDCHGRRTVLGHAGLKKIVCPLCRGEGTLVLDIDLSLPYVRSEARPAPVTVAAMLAPTPPLPALVPVPDPERRPVVANVKSSDYILIGRERIAV